jgi:hypothetical protein
VNPIENPRAWYMAWNFGLVTYAILLGLIGLGVLLYWLGPIVIAKGLSRWEASQPLFRKSATYQLPKGMTVTSELVQVLGSMAPKDARMN